MKVPSNLEIAAMMRKMVVAYQILGENRFKIIAYERASDAIEHLSREVSDMWKEGKLDSIPGVGSTIVGHLDELFKTGKISHFEKTLAKIPPAVFPLLSVPGIGPKKAAKLVEHFHFTNEKTVVGELEKVAKKGKIAELDGFGEKSEKEILASIALYRLGAIKEERITIDRADEIAGSVIAHLLTCKDVKAADVLGSLRRRAPTIGDIDIAIETTKPDVAIDHFITYPHKKLIEKGPTGASLLLSNGRQVDLRVCDRKTYGSMLQYFTGSKQHNIALRTFALSKGLSLSEYGIKHVKKGSVEEFSSEKEFYEYLGMDYIPPELREDRGEITAALDHKLPTLVCDMDVKGDFHIHTSYDLKPSHDLGLDPIETIFDEATKLHYDYIGISDHNPSVGNHSAKEIVSIMEKREKFYRTHHDAWEKKTKKKIHLFVMLEVDIQPDGTLALPVDAFEFVDGVIVSIHSSFRMERKEMTERITKALEGHPKVRILGHPTGRILTERDGYDADWEKIFAIASSRSIAIEINAHPYRLDLPERLVYEARRSGVTFTIDSDSHRAIDLVNMKYGVTVARRGWCTSHDIMNTKSVHDVNEWMKKT